jgi:hypothetical protein
MIHMIHIRLSGGQGEVGVLGQCNASGARHVICIRIIGVFIVYMQYMVYNCVYYCGTCIIIIDTMGQCGASSARHGTRHKRIKDTCCMLVCKYVQKTLLELSFNTYLGHLNSAVQDIC